MVAGPLAFVALIAGWITTEVGRQPWIVYQVMRTEEAVTQADGLEVGYVVLVLVYLGVGAAVVWLLRRLAPQAAGDRGDRWLSVCAGFVVLGIAAYAVLGSADFGAGFWDLTAGGARRGGRLRGMIQRSMAPVWEANHVWLIFVLVIVWTAFPKAFGSIFSTLYIPLFLAAIGIIFRGTAFALRGQAATINEARVLGALFATASVLIPFCFGAVLGGIASGRVGHRQRDRRPVDVVAEPDVGADRRDRGAHRRLPRGGLPRGRLGARRAAGPRAGVPGARAAGGRRRAASSRSAACSVLRSDSRALYDGLTSGGGLAMVIVSALAGASTLALVWTERYGLARVSSALAVVAIVVGWALAQNPYLLPPDLTLDGPRPPTRRCRRRSSSSALGMLILGPSLWYLYRLVLRGQLDQTYEPLDQRFHT